LEFPTSFVLLIPGCIYLWKSASKGWCRIS